jgi:predicted HTH domain antitoxin
MAITFELPGLEAVLREQYGGDLNQAARDALLIDAYRSGRLSIGRLAATLGLTTIQTVQWLDGHGVGPNYSPADFESDRRSFDDARRETNT